MRTETDDYFELSPKERAFQLRSALQVGGIAGHFRLLLMNLHLHKIDRSIWISPIHCRLTRRQTVTRTLI
jgi:hypothetical protein